MNIQNFVEGVIMTDNDRILRVDTFTNFNYTDEEFKQLESIAHRNPIYKIFVNSNAYNEIKGNYPVVVTVNPKIDEFVRPRGDLSLIKAARIKFVADPNDWTRKAFNQAVEWCISKKIPILITYMRFRKSETMKRYSSSNFNYLWAKNYFRQKIKKTWDLDCFNYCDLHEKGCPDCQNCAKLTYGIKAPIYSINLSTSGNCKFNCPDCYVKTISQWHGGNICMDKIMQNTKQIGKDVGIYKYGQRQLKFDNFVKWTDKKSNQKI